MQLEGLDGVLKTLKSLPPELISKRGGVVLKSLRAGAKVIQKEAKKNLLRSVSTPGKTGVNWSTGFTEKYLVIRRSKIKSGENGERVSINVKPQVHPSGNKGVRGGKLKANEIARMLEYGTSKQEAEPWMRPAFLATAELAIQTTKSDLLKQIDKVVNKLASQNKGK